MTLHVRIEVAKQQMCVYMYTWIVPAGEVPVVQWLFRNIKVNKFELPSP